MELSFASEQTGAKFHRAVRRNPGRLLLSHTRRGFVFCWPVFSSFFGGAKLFHVNLRLIARLPWVVLFVASGACLFSTPNRSSSGLETRI